jgi:hypothetical protein
MYDVVVYFSSLQKQDPGRKIDTLEAFATGASSAGANVLIERDYIFRPAKLAVILGWPSPVATTPNIKFRSEIVTKQKAQGNHVMAIDANCFKFGDTESKYLRYSLNGVYYDTSEYANTNSTSEKWDNISKEFNLDIRNWHQDGDHILFLIQRDGGWGMKGLNPVQWAQDKIKQIKQISNLPIILRPHPGKVADLSSLVQPGVTISDSVSRPLTKDLKRAKSALVFNSSSGVASILAGVPLWVDDSSSVCWDVANKDLSNFNSPTFFDRTQWIYDLAACHWSDEESRQGLIYKKFLPYLT